MSVDVSTVDLYALWEEYSTMSLKCIAYRCKIWFRKKFVEYTENMYSYVCVMVSYTTVFFSKWPLLMEMKSPMSQTCFCTIFCSSRPELI